MAQKQKRIPDELIEAVGRAQATRILDRVSELEKGNIDSFSFKVDADKMEKTDAAMNKFFANVEALSLIGDYERETMLYTVRRSSETKQREFGAPKEAPAEPVHETIGAKLSGMKTSRELAKTLVFMMPRLTEHAENVQEGKPSSTNLDFNSIAEAKEAEKVLRETGMLGNVSRKGDLVTLQYLKMIEGGTSFVADYGE